MWFINLNKMGKGEYGLCETENHKPRERRVDRRVYVIGNKIGNPEKTLRRKYG